MTPAIFASVITRIAAIFRAATHRRYGRWLVTVAPVALGLALACALPLTSAHGVQEGDAALLATGTGARIFVFMYLGAKHMVTGYDHLLFLFGVVFFLRRPRDVLMYVTLFAVGHSVTLLSGVLLKIQAYSWLVDAVIGLSVAYKAIDNLGGWRGPAATPAGRRGAVLGFGLVHGLGLATSLQRLPLPRQGLVENLLAFNIGVELGQLAALCAMMALLLAWRRRDRFNCQAVLINRALLGAGLLLTGYQLAGYTAQAAMPGQPDANAHVVFRAYPVPFRSDTVDIPLAAGGELGKDELEWKVRMRAGQSLVYSWTVNAAPDEFYADFHGQSDAKPKPVVQSYLAGMGAASHGVLVAPFDGIHGWYLQNQSATPVVVHLRLSGFYTMRPVPTAPE